MLGRRAAVVGTVAALAVGGGSAVAATHGGSHSTPKTKPKVHRVYHAAKIPARIRKLNHCSHMHGDGAMGTMPGV